jgi:hypothetical protein
VLRPGTYSGSGSGSTPFFETCVSYPTRDYSAAVASSARTDEAFARTPAEIKVSLIHHGEFKK